MKKDYNRDVMSDMPVDSSSFAPSTKTTKTTTTTKPKISAIGTQKRTTSSKTTTSKTSSTSKAGTKSLTSKTTSTASKTGAKTSTTKKTTTSSKTTETISKTDQKATENKKLRTKLTNSSDEISDLEKLNEQNIKSYRFKSKRNKVIISLLSVLLVLSIATIATFLIVSRLKTNCHMYIHGDVSAVFIVDGQEMDEFRTPSNLQGNRIFNLNIDIRIETSAEYRIKFTPKVYQKGVLISNTLIYKHNRELFYDGGDGYYYSINTIQGNQTISLCEGVILDYYYENTLNVDNFKLDFHVYFEKV